MQSIPVFVISLKRSPERRAAISDHLNRLEVEYTIVDAVDGKALDPDYADKRWRPIPSGREVIPIL